MLSTLQAIVQALPWASMTASKTNEQDDTAITSASTDYYATDSLYRPPAMQRATTPSAQSLIQETIIKWTSPQLATVPLAGQCELLMSVVDAGQGVTGDLCVRWQPEEFLLRMTADVDKVRHDGLMAGMRSAADAFFLCRQTRSTRSLPLLDWFSGSVMHRGSSPRSSYATR